LKQFKKISKDIQWHIIKYKFVESSEWLEFKMVVRMSKYFATLFVMQHYSAAYLILMAQ